MKSLRTLVLSTLLILCLCCRGVDGLLKSHHHHQGLKLRTTEKHREFSSNLTRQGSHHKVRNCGEFESKLPYVHDRCVNMEMATDTVLYEGDGHDMTPDVCYQFCVGHKSFYFGVSKGTSCVCGNSYTEYFGAGPAHCNVPCAGNPEEMCGGKYSIDVYIIGRDCNSEPEPSAITTTTGLPTTTTSTGLPTTTTTATPCPAHTPANNGGKWCLNADGSSSVIDNVAGTDPTNPPQLASLCACAEHCASTSGCTHFLYKENDPSDPNPYRCTTWSSCASTNPDSGVSGIVYTLD